MLDTSLIEKLFSFVSAVIVTLVTFLLTRAKYKAEVEKIQAETEKIKKEIDLLRPKALSEGNPLTEMELEKRIKERINEVLHNTTPHR